MAKRVGAKSIRDIDSNILQSLNDGVIESASLSEAMAIDFSQLMSSAFPQIDLELIENMESSHKLGITKRMHKAALILLKFLGKENAFDILANHPSDTVRGWGAYALESNPSLSFIDKLAKIQRLADDKHFCVREWAWLAMRPSISQNIEVSIQALLPWVTNKSENVRRYAIEATRPRGVWSKHIIKLKNNPSIGKPLLDEVMSDSSRYVQNSCANWLNDAGKSHPSWVVEFCKNWKKKNQSDEVAYVIHKALRNIA